MISVKKPKIDRRYLSILVLVIALTLGSIGVFTDFAGENTFEATTATIGEFTNGVLGAVTAEENHIETQDLFKRGDTHDVNDFSAFILGEQQSDIEQSEFREEGTENLEVQWGIRFWRLDQQGNEEEITGGDPVAVVSRTEEGAGLQTEAYEFSETELEPEDALLTRVYIQVGGGDFEEVATHTSEQLDASKITENIVAVNYYTEYETEDGGPPGGRFTRGTYRWGDEEFNSRIEDFEYERARVEATQTNPIDGLDTYPEDEFEHETEVTCEAESCEEIEIVPEACQGEECTNFEPVSDLEDFGLEWSADSQFIEELNRDETVLENFTVTPEDEGIFRVRMSVNSTNVAGDITEFSELESHTAQVNLTEFAHQNLEEVGLNEYETGDTIEFAETQLTAEEGKAFDVFKELRIVDSEGAHISWGSGREEECENIEEDETCERVFDEFQIPEDESSGEYNFNIDWSWENEGEETDTRSFDIVNLRTTFDSNLDEERIFQGEETEFTFNFTNEWSTNIEEAEINVNCPSEVQCDSLDQNTFSSIDSGETVESSFEISSEEDTETGEYDINATIQYENPSENRIWEQVENEDLQISSEGALVTEILLDEDELNRTEQYDLDGYLENTGDDVDDVELEWTVPEDWENVEGERLKEIDQVGSGERVYNNITEEITLLAERGIQEIQLTSRVLDEEDRGETTTKEVEVYAPTDIDLELNESNVAHGDKVLAEIGLNLDTGGVLEDQEIVLVNAENHDLLGEDITNDDGEASIEFEADEDWEVKEHDILVAYEENDTIYTRGSEDIETLEVSDIPQIEDVETDPDQQGVGYNTTINATVTDEEGIEEVTAHIKTPEENEEQLNLQNIEDTDIYTKEYSETWEEGTYEFNVTAEDVNGFTNTSTGHEFEIIADAEINVVTDKEEYGPYENVLLDREDSAQQILETNYTTMTEERVAEILFSEEFSTVSGTSTFHTNTHENDGERFEMTEEGGGPPDEPDEFEGIYFYEAELEDPSRIDISSLGNIDNDNGGSWEVQVRNYETDEWDPVFEITENQDTWYNETICSGGACEDIVQNNEIEIRVFTQSDRDTEEFTYEVEYQELEFRTDEGPVNKTDEPETLEIGATGHTNNRYYNNYDLDDLPLQDSAQIESAEIQFTVPEGFGTGEIHHVEVFESDSDPEEIHRSDEPEESTQDNPIATFEVEEGEDYSIEVTGAAQDSYESGSDFVSFQFREEDETVPYELEERPTLEINYTSESELVNVGDEDVRGFLLMRTQVRDDGEWQNVGFPVVDESDGEFPVDTSESLDLAEIWADKGAWNTEVRSEGLYRVKTVYVDSEGNPIVTEDDMIRDTYEFEIIEPELELTNVSHSNQLEYSINEFETLDILDYVDVTVNNTEATAANATVELNVLDELGQQVEWGPDEIKVCGDLDPGENCTERFDNDGAGYQIPEDAATETFEFTWNTTLDAENTESQENQSFTFTIHNVQEEFESLIEADQNRVFRNESTLYNFTVNNPWTESLENVELEVQCNEDEIGCEGLDSGTNVESFDEIGPRDSEEASFNLTTDSETEIDDYAINTTVTYTNPGQQNKVWEEQENEVLRVRIPGSLINVTESPETVTRGKGDYRFESYTNNTFDDDLTNVTTEWDIPEDWNNQTGSLTEFEEVQEPGELVFNNFTAEIDSESELGEVQARKTATNDQGREDDFFVEIDVFADTEIELEFNDTEPAIGETVEVQSRLLYDNSTPISAQELEFYDETIDEKLDEGVTNDDGEYTFTFEAEEPEDDHIINATYDGSEDLYTNPTFTEENITVTGTPNITRLDAQPELLGYGKETTLEAELEGEEDIETVEVEIILPDGTSIEEEMIEVEEDLYQTEFNDTWQNGVHEYEVTAINEQGNEETADSEFEIEVDQKSTIQTENDEYFAGEQVNLTTQPGTWWDTDWEYRTLVEAEEISDTDLDRYPTQIVLENLSDKTNECEDLRVIQDLEPVDIYVEDCETDGETIIYSETTIESLDQEEIYVYYGNDEVEAQDNEAYAFNIEDSGSRSSDTSLGVTEEYNDGEAIFRQVEITVFGDDLEARVSAFNYETEEFETLFEGEPADGETIVDERYFNDPRYSQLDISIEDTSNNPSTVAYEYNYTTPQNIETEIIREEEKLPSLIEDLGETEFEGRIQLEVQKEENGEWETREEVFSEENPREINEENLGELWNEAGGWVCDEERGTYRAKFKLIDPEGNVLEDSGEEITAEYEFEILPPPTEVDIDNIEIYNVTDSSDPEDDTSNLEDSGLNQTFRIIEDEEYRFDFSIENEEDAEETWFVTENDIIEHMGLNENWGVETDNIFYENETDRVRGGEFDGNITWDTSEEIAVDPGDTARFAYIIDIPEGEDLRDITFEIDDTSFTETDESELEIVESSDTPPGTEFFELNQTEIRRGESIEATAEWNESIDDSVAEYNSTTEVLENFTVEAEGEWTNYTFTTDDDWIREEHQFRFFAQDFSGNWGKTIAEWFDVFGEVRIEEIVLDPEEVEIGEETELACRVLTDRDEPIDNYSVEFFNETDTIDEKETNSEGWANTTYSQDEAGEEELSCAIFDDEERFYLTPGEDQSFDQKEQLLTVLDSDAPDYENEQTNATRIFKTTEDHVGEFYAEWTDSSELDTAVLTFGDEEADEELPESPFDQIDLEGEEDNSEFIVSPPNDVSPQNTTWNIHANDTSGNVNTTSDLDTDIWAWSFIDDEESGTDRTQVETDMDVTKQCRIEEGNTTGIANYDVEFADNRTGEFETLGTNDTDESGIAEFTTSYEETGKYEIECRIEDERERNIEAFTGEDTFSAMVEVVEELDPPQIVDDNYFLSDERVFIEENITSHAQWDSEIETAEVEIEGETELEDEVPEPYTDNWTNYTLETNETFELGEHGIKTIVEDTDGNINDTLEFLDFEIWSTAEVHWEEPEGEIEQQDETDLVCSVQDEVQENFIENYNVEFYDEDLDFIGENQTDEEGFAELTIDTSEDEGEQEYSCRIEDEEELFYEAGEQDTDTGNFEFVDELDAELVGEITDPINETALAKDKVFELNGTIECREGDCGEVEAISRYNESGTSPDTEIESEEGTPFHTLEENRRVCSEDLLQGESCNVTWEVNATGEEGSDHSLDIQMDGESANTNTTEPVHVSIDFLLLLEVGFDELDFGSGPPSGDEGDLTVQEAPENNEGVYTIGLNEDSNDADDGLWLRTDGLEHETEEATDSDEENNLIPPEHTLYGTNDATDECETFEETVTTRLSDSFLQAEEELGSGESVEQCYFQEIPNGKIAGPYQGSLTIKVNATN